MPRVGDTFSALVRDLGSTGDGIVEHPGGRVFFVAGAWPGERVTVRVTALKGRHGRAALLRVEEAFSGRVEPACPHHGFGADDCGGCPWQFASYEAQLDAKQRRVEQALARLGIGADVIQPIIASDHQLGYRNRAQFKTDGRRLGYVARGSRALVDVRECPVLSEANRRTLAQLRSRLPNVAWRPPGKRDWTTLDIAEEEGEGEGACSVNRRLPFRQANSPQNTRMREWLGDRLSGLPRELPVLELFAGSGNFTRVIAGLGFERIAAVEAAPAALAELERSRLDNVSVMGLDLYVEGALARLRRETGAPGILLLDPPRDGLKDAAALFAPRLPPFRHVFYISCDLATFARDASVLLGAGYRTVEIQPLDLFPQTPHVEILGYFRFL